MNKTHFAVFAVAFCLLASVGAVPAAAQDSESSWSFSVDTAFASQYLWRGFKPNSSPALQPTIRLGYKGFSISSWASLHQKQEGWGQNLIEHDMTLDYTHSYKKLSLSGGYIWYHWPGLDEKPLRNTQEFYIGASYDTALSPSFTYYRDFDEGKGNYFYGSIGHSLSMGKGVALNLGTGLGINNKMWIDRTAVSNWDINVSLDIPTGGKVTFSPFFLQMIGAKPEFGNNNVFGVSMRVVSLP